MGPDIDVYECRRKHIYTSDNAVWVCIGNEKKTEDHSYVLVKFLDLVHGHVETFGHAEGCSHYCSSFNPIGFITEKSLLNLLKHWEIPELEWEDNE